VIKIFQVLFSNIKVEGLVEIQVFTAKLIDQMTKYTKWINAIIDSFLTYFKCDFYRLIIT